MRCGIDFGTTRIVTAAVDRGNYPVVAFEDVDGDLVEFLPSVVALDGDGDEAVLRVGWDALAAAERGAPLVRSVKRMLADSGVTPATPVRFSARQQRPLGDVLAALAAATVDGIRDALDLDAQEPIDAVVGVPANAGSAQRLLTLGAFSNAGVRVDALVNEPSAAAFEYTHRHPRSLTSRRTDVVVYDLGGGTFDASLVHIDGVDHEVRRSLGLSRLGGDDLDAGLADLILTRAPELAGRPGFDRAHLLDACRSAKERIVPQSRRIVVEFGDDDITVPVDDYFAAVTPVITETIDAMAPLVGAGAEGSLADTGIAGLYLVGGASELPLVPRLLRERFGRRVHRSPYPSASTAIGLAIAADPDSGYRLRDRLARGIGVFRELDHGRGVGFDALIVADASLGPEGTITVTRRYRAAHNIGWFRFVEYRELDDGEPRGDLLPVAELRMPFDARLQDGRPLQEVPVERIADGPEVEERVDVDANGIATFRVRDLRTGFETSVVAARDPH